MSASPPAGTTLTHPIADATPLGILAYGDAAGCACKADWALMEEVRGLDMIRQAAASQLGLGDAAVLSVAGGFATSVDFIGPVARDAADYGYVAAAHAMSDLFAVGAVPTHALAIAAWPRDPSLHSGLLTALDGMRAAAADVGAVILGGHTAHCEQPLLGLCVFGRLDASPRKREIQAGDAVYLTKPLGSGVAIGALREGERIPELERAALMTMRTLNTAGHELARNDRVKLVSDVTGFGLIGQALRLAETSNLSVRFEGAALPGLENVRDLIKRGVGSSAAERNWGLIRRRIQARNWVDAVLAADPQTNGPLLVVGEPGLEGATLARVGALCTADAVPVHID